MEEPTVPKVEEPKEICGFMAAMEYGVAQKVNLYATREEVIEKIQDFRSNPDTNTIISLKLGSNSVGFNIPACLVLAKI